MGALVGDGDPTRPFVAGRKPRRAIVGTSRENCPVIAMLEARQHAENDINMRDGLMAEALNHEPRGAEQLMAQCVEGGPHKTWFGFGKLACSSELFLGEPEQIYDRALLHDQL